MPTQKEPRVLLVHRVLKAFKVIKVLAVQVHKALAVFKVSRVIKVFKVSRVLQEMYRRRVFRDLKVSKVFKAPMV